MIRNTVPFLLLCAVSSVFAAPGCGEGDCEVESCADWGGPASASFKSCVSNVGGDLTNSTADFILRDAAGDELFRCKDKQVGGQTVGTCPDDFAGAKFAYCEGLPSDPAARGTGGSGAGTGGNGTGNSGAGNSGAGNSGTGGSGATGSGAGGPGGGGQGGAPGCSTDYPVACPARHGAAAGCWAEDSACASVVACPWGDAACPAGYAVDCSDSWCVPVLVPEESTDAACSNGFDDDGNGYTDCADLRCASNPLVTACEGESSDDLCSNGFDDDGNGYTDCADLACRTSPSVTVCGPGEKTDEACANGFDDDGNGYTDCFELACRVGAFTSVCGG